MTVNGSIKIRRAGLSDRDQLRRIYLEAFDEQERKSVAALASDLLAEASLPETLNLVAELDTQVVGAIAFSPVWFQETRYLAGYILAPLAVGPEHQNKGVGTALVEEGRRQLAHRDGGLILVYGDPAYYGRFGFETHRAENYRPPFPLKYPSGWLAVDLMGGEAAGPPTPIECVEALNKPELW